MGRKKKPKELSPNLSHLLRIGSKSPKLEGLLEAMLRQWGGPDRFCEEYKKVYEESSDEKTKARMMDKIMWLVQQTTKNRASETDWSQATEEELTKTALELMSHAKENGKKRDGNLDRPSPDASGSPGGSELSGESGTGSVPGVRAGEPVKESPPGVSSEEDRILKALQANEATGGIPQVERPGTDHPGQ